MNTLLFLAIALAVIVISIALQKLLNNAFLVSAIIFVIFIIVAAITGDLIWVIAAILYAILAFITIVTICIICKICDKLSCRECIIGSESGSMCTNNNNNNGNETANAGITQDDIQDLTRALNQFTNCCCRRRR